MMIDAMMRATTIGRSSGEKEEEEEEEESEETQHTIRGRVDVYFA
jgi:hypothetical protein